jgi:hypothetical protein
MRVDVDAIQQAFTDAQGNWRGCDWSTRFGPDGIELCGLNSRWAWLMARATSGQEAVQWKEAAVWLAELETDAASAEQEARAAMDLVHAGDLANALLRARRACELERKYRTPRIWQPLCMLIEACLRQIDTTLGEEPNGNQ